MVMELRRTRADVQRRATRALARTARAAAGSLLTRYLAAVLVLLAGVMLLAPAPRDLPAPAVWDYQHEQVDVSGGGLLNGYATTLIGATAATARTAVERQRDLHRFSLLEATAGPPAARGVTTLADRGRLALEGATVAALIALVGYGVFGNPRRRVWMAAIGLLLGGTLLVTHPAAVLRAAAVPGEAVETASVRALTLTDPTRAPRAVSTAAAQQEIASEYWAQFVGGPLARMTTGSRTLADAPAAEKPAVLAFLAERISAVNDWAVGERGAERAVIATLALAYALPFALATWALSMLATAAQTLLVLLLLAGLAAIPAAVEPTWRARVKRLWLIPLAGSCGALAAASLLGLGTLRLATVIHGGDEYLGMLLGGAILPVAALALTTRYLVRRWRSRRTRKPPTPKPRRGAKPARSPEPAGSPDALGGVA
jgi:hypothetical protein